MKKEEISNINIQLIATYLFIFSLFISLIITYNDRHKTIYGKGFLSKDLNYKISVLNRILILGISFAYLYVNFKNKEFSKIKGNDTSAFNLQIMASELSILAALIVTYVVITSGEYSIVTSSENPGL